ncbi:hypothetical protein A2291_01345 [candidate division WOR-1 bacterium RIFOXYB2_FULL_42_35]|uniref:Uncharacterized protein n=1 Tax=candidate division WOR-1 bacterium RIFOXYC2_FULL_41_25 TaxID=1802586 RepID=A0A1F4TL44_UNCSA|nr:MAG: hypothetical protein A2247_04770 [candidate division WOR-1 bacterium RIFOXYA2_FULL_41_14]OGC22951.1 MAG: hypothetical protein A2291_01345 [candidate division WOR-1 bacterium RIFOXYB2_FULL_42_35]OGC33432.1 MAG: hypothetical protein A2462_06735 [candidate division WOR-1 bacterium RIFOXYC2_FULL_41_25]OGC42890.1 MAG: hypothetical protein A2548_03780 [candidate division WOR-1 bacterium RIFOXYD2_FULL_41_8]
MSFKNFKILTIMVLAAFVWTFAAASICQAEKGFSHCGGQQKECQLVIGQQTAKLISAKQLLPKLVLLADLLYSQRFKDKSYIIHAPPSA